jgi:hypothetical protein
VLDEGTVPRRSARIAALIHGESSKQAATRSRSSSPESDEDEPLYWPAGGWPHVQPLAGTGSLDPQASTWEGLFGEHVADLPEMPIGEAEPLFSDSQEHFFHASSDSGCEEEMDDSTEEDYSDEENELNLDEMLLPPEMLHSVASLRPPKRRRRTVAGVGRQGSHLPYGDGVGSGLHEGDDAGACAGKSR